MTADLVARLDEYAPVVAKYGLVQPHSRASLAALLREAASALRSSGEAVAWAVRDHGDGKLWMVDTDQAHASRQAELNDDTLVPLYLHPATPASAWRPIADGWALVFSDPRDFCASASKLIGATYSDPDAAARRFANKSLRGEGMAWGDILAFAPTPPSSTNARRVCNRNCDCVGPCKAGLED